MLERILHAIDTTRDESLRGLFDFLRIPSISTQPDHAGDVRRCAAFVAERCAEAGMTPEVVDTEGHPAVIAASPRRSGRPTVLLYGHYDVQPPEPLDLWTTPAFEPTIRNDAIYARGACDDKGQVWAHLRALKLWHRLAGELPVNVIALIEGEEEIGSKHLPDLIERHRDRLRADIAVISDTSQFARGRPAITCGLRGLVYLEVTLHGPARDLHSGIYGGSVPNPANVLARLLASLHDAQGRVQIPGFYDDVKPLTDAERRQFAELGFDEAAANAALGLPFGSGEAGFSTLERRWARPTCDINGITTGYQGPGAKTVIPAVASAKLSCRLVPWQNPQAIQAALIKHLTDQCPANVRMEFTPHGAGGPVLLDSDSPAARLAAQAVRTGFGVPPVFIREGGSIPVVARLQQMLGVQTLLLGFGLDDDAIHAPNEKFDLDALHKGERTAAALYEALAQL